MRDHTEGGGRNFFAWGGGRDEIGVGERERVYGERKRFAVDRLNGIDAQEVFADASNLAPQIRGRRTYEGGTGVERGFGGGEVRCGFLLSTGAGSDGYAAGFDAG